MGAGKGYSLSWMSANGYLPLQNIVHVDPESFKVLMPEWNEYLKRNEPQSDIGKFFHRETCYMAEIAQELAMQHRQHVWVDGSLRDGVWFSKVFDDIRKRFPNYYIAIFYVFASAETVRNRIRARSEKTGRWISEDVIKTSIDAPNRSLALLTCKVDFVARIRNEGKVPELVAYEIVDRSGQFELIREQFARHEPPPSRFPNALAPMFVVATTVSNDHLQLSLSPRESIDELMTWLVSDSLLTFSKNLRAFFKLCPRRSGYMSPLHAVNIGTKARAELLIPPSAVSFAWVSPLMTHNQIFEHDLDIFDPNVMLFTNGGFAYFDLEDSLICINAIGGFLYHACPKSLTNTTIQFGPPIPVTPDMVKEVERRLVPVTWRLQNSEKLLFAWIKPRERINLIALTAYGGFMFVNRSEGWAVCFPITT
eukprot:c16343_g1_i1.p1 GENE.c16343_g1_i1~~c16343_g1_i1.p1  ORF type:complete len:457 (-),score=113.78 c16343_g1_i1:50-1318(-)